MFVDYFLKMEERDRQECEGEDNTRKGDCYEVNK